MKEGIKEGRKGKEQGEGEGKGGRKKRKKKELVCLSTLAHSFSPKFEGCSPSW